ncbi:MOSC domain-containing protein [Lewinella sp. 4G2]|uniref:MOSC domain-containing protein n=1 Tax=Lewinella sp. 4G2 TaxID=1803372 RepID=UPI0007B4AD07|nr:MOSC N-terminal beta barrel domain-containing protein [Lewinella sp. 4G2]OAV45668.1 hypothetical protein A3850_014720 [Lewinella sp. 4G2]
MHVTELYRYPVKSLGGQSVQSLQPLGRGFVDDRRWMFADASGRFISQRNNVQLSEFSAELVGDELTFRHLPSNEVVGAVAGARLGTKSTVTVWDDTFQATEVNSDAMYALTRKLGIPDARLMYMQDDDIRPVDTRYAKGEETVSFADGYPYLITNTASLRALAHEMGEASLDVRRFRPNIVVDSPTAFAEDAWFRLEIGTHQFRLPKPCARCIMITHEPGTRGRDLRVLGTLSNMRKVGNKILFGMNACWEGGDGSVAVGDEVTVTENHANTEG